MKIDSNEFKITGYYYNKYKYQFRKYLNIRRNNSPTDNPDLMVIMMNPGGSKPKIEKYDIETEAIADKTQLQIMKVMDNCSFNYARILNLSDLREPKSNVFYKMIPKLESENISHSIFNKKRTEELKGLFIGNITIVFAWGVNRKLKILANRVIDVLNVKEPIGWNKKNNEYYHPLPRSQKKQCEWVNRITSQIKNIEIKKS